MIYNLTKQYNDKYMIENVGKFIDYDDTWLILKENNDEVYHEGKLICKILRNEISEELCKLGEKCFMETSKMISTNRGAAGGQSSRTKKNNYETSNGVHSSIVGYIDSANHKRPCRLTQYTRDHIEKFNESLPFINKVNELFKENVEDRYKKQYERAQKSKYNIDKTAFSTITVNYNFRTALHKDSGDYEEGFGNIVVLDKDIEGGYLLYPQYKFGIELKRGDYCALNVHEWHCNSNIIYKNEKGYRMSFVFYLREKIINCDKVNDNLNKLLGNLNGKMWKTDIIFDDIFKETGTPKREMIGNKWWTMKTERYILEYKNKRYKLYDILKDITIYNLMSAWEYINNHRQFQEGDD